MEKKCSVLIPVYNQEELIKRCIESIPNRDDIEIIVVDDCSTDNSSKVVGKYKNVQVIVNDHNLGIGLTRQKLVDLATGEFIYFLDSDDYVDTTLFNELLDSLPENYDIIETMQIMNTGRIFQSKVWRGAFIKANIAKSVAFKDMRCHEDTTWKNDVILQYPKLTKILLEDKVLYHYNFPRANSLTDIDKHGPRTESKTFMSGGYFGL